MRVLRRAWGNTWSLIASHSKWKKCVFGGFLLLLGFLLAFLFLEEEKVKDEAVILILFAIVPFGVTVIVLFLWNLWLAPFELMEDKFVSNVHSLGTVVKAPEAPDLEQWKSVSSLNLYQVAELGGGISPRVNAGTGERSNDASRAIYSRLQAALISGDLKGNDEWANAYTRINREDLQKYFAGRDDCPEFLKE